MKEHRGAAGRRIGNLLIAAEVALAVMLLIGSGLLLRTIWQLHNINPGFDIATLSRSRCNCLKRSTQTTKQVTSFQQTTRVEEVSDFARS